MKFANINHSRPLILLIAFLLFSIGCNEKDPLTSDSEPPEIPPVSTFNIDFNEFPDTTTSAIPKTFLTRANWGWAAANVGVWNTLITLTLAVPTAAFGESFRHTPVLQPDGSWLWTYNVLVTGNLYTAKLYGKTVTDGVEWRMLLTRAGHYADYEWYTGFCNLPLTEGNWTLNKDPNNPSPFIYIEWHRNPSDSTSDIKYTNIIPGHADNGGYIFYARTKNTPFNTSYTIYSKSQNNYNDIEWDRSVYNGRVMDVVHFSDSLWHCWDENLWDIDCP